MTKEEAFQILKCNQLDDVQDAYEDALFVFKSKFLQQIPPIKVIKAIQKKIKRLNSAFDFFNPDVELIFSTYKGSQFNNLVSFLDEYQQQLAQIRLKITNTTNGTELIDLIDKLIDHQSDLFKNLSSFLTVNEIDLDEYPIKLSDEINVFAIQSELKVLDIDDTKISEYIRAQIERLKFDEFADMTKAVINAEKQMIYNELRR